MLLIVRYNSCWAVASLSLVKFRANFLNDAQFLTPLDTDFALLQCSIHYVADLLNNFLLLNSKMAPERYKRLSNFYCRWKNETNLEWEIKRSWNGLLDLKFNLWDKPETKALIVFQEVEVEAY